MSEDQEILRGFIREARHQSMGLGRTPVERLLRDYLSKALDTLERMVNGQEPDGSAKPTEDTPEVKRDKDAALIDRLQRENYAQEIEIARLKDLLGRCGDDRDTAERALLLIERNHIGSDIIELYDICLVAGGARAREAITRLTNDITADEVPF